MPQKNRLQGHDYTADDLDWRPLPGGEYTALIGLQREDALKIHERTVKLLGTPAIRVQLQTETTTGTPRETTANTDKGRNRPIIHVPLVSRIHFREV